MNNLIGNVNYEKVHFSNIPVHGRHINYIISVFLVWVLQCILHLNLLYYVICTQKRHNADS